MELVTFIIHNLHTCYRSNLGMADVSSVRVGYFAGVPSRCIFVALMKTLQDTGVSNDLGVVPVGGIQLLAILVPCDEQLWGPREGAFQSELLTQKETHILELLDKASRF